MSVIIAGSGVALGDQLFSRRAGAVGTVIQVLDHAVVLRITRNGQHRDLTVTGNGQVAGSRDVFWHPPIELDLPKGSGVKLQKIQTLVDALNDLL